MPNPQIRATEAEVVLIERLRAMFPKPDFRDQAAETLAGMLYPDTLTDKGEMRGRADALTGLWREQHRRIS